MPIFLEGEWILEVDFNNVAEQGRFVKCSVRRVPGWRPRMGERVFLNDADGNSCHATVARMVGPIVYLEPDDATWRTIAPVVQTWAMAHEYSLAV
jgi:hypothetical protein